MDIDPPSFSTSKVLGGLQTFSTNVFISLCQILIQAASFSCCGFNNRTYKQKSRIQCSIHMHTFLCNYSFLAKNYAIKYNVMWIHSVMVFFWGGGGEKTAERTHNHQPINHKNEVNYTVNTTVRFRLTNTESEH